MMKPRPANMHPLELTPTPERCANCPFAFCLLPFAITGDIYLKYGILI
jgi:hypothetical protein